MDLNFSCISRINKVSKYHEENQTSEYFLKVALGKELTKDIKKKTKSYYL